MFTKLFCPNDPILELLDEHLQASIVKVPDERIYPLRVIEKTNKKVAKFRGKLENITTISIPEADLDELLEDKRMANISGTKSTATNSELGLKILQGFLKGFSANVPNLKAHFKDVTKVSFSFENVARKWIDNNLLGRELRDLIIDRANPATAGFFNNPASKLLVIDSIITSNDFSIHVEDAVDDSFQFEAAAIQEELGKLNTKIEVASTSNLSLTFKGTQPLPFAFTTIELKLDSTGKVTKMPAYTKNLPQVFGSTDGAFVKTKIEDELGLIDIDFSE